MNPEDVIKATDYASRMSDRWLFVFLLIILIAGGLVIIRFLFTQLEKQREAHAALNREMAVALHECAEVMKALRRHLEQAAKLLLVGGALLLGGCTQAELEAAARAANAGLSAYYGPPAPEPRVWLNPPGVPFPIVPPEAP